MVSGAAVPYACMARCGRRPGVQEVPKTAEHAPSKTIFLYHASAHGAFAQITHDLHKAAGTPPPRRPHPLRAFARQPCALAAHPCCAALFLCGGPPLHLPEPATLPVRAVRAVHAMLHAPLSRCCLHRCADVQPSRLARSACMHALW